MDMVCVGTFNPFGINALNRPGCGEKWENDTRDGLCPICRGRLIPESLVTDKHRKNMLYVKSK